MYTRRKITSTVFSYLDQQYVQSKTIRLMKTARSIATIRHFPAIILLVGLGSLFAACSTQRVAIDQAYEGTELPAQQYDRKTEAARWQSLRAVPDSVLAVGSAGGSQAPQQPVNE